MRIRFGEYFSVDVRGMDAEVEPTWVRLAFLLA